MTYAACSEVMNHVNSSDNVKLIQIVGSNNAIFNSVRYDFDNIVVDEAKECLIVKDKVTKLTTYITLDQIGSFTMDETGRDKFDSNIIYPS